MLAKAVAHSTSATFIRATGADLIQKNSGEGSKIVRLDGFVLFLLKFETRQKSWDPLHYSSLLNLKLRTAGALAQSKQFWLKRRSVFPASEKEIYSRDDENGNQVDLET